MEPRTIKVHGEQAKTITEGQKFIATLSNVEGHDAATLTPIPGDDQLRGLPIPKECNLYNGMTLEILMSKATEWDKVVTNPDYIEQTENALKALRLENHQQKTALKQSMDHVNRILPIAETNQKKLKQIFECVNSEILSVERTLAHPSWILDEGELVGRKRTAGLVLKILEKNNG